MDGGGIGGQGRWVLVLVGSAAHTQVCVLALLCSGCSSFHCILSALFCFALCIDLVFVMRSDLALVVVLLG